ncbi:sensor histidine kinase [Allorhizocola rhizosphaerae]|uniref:sensor histidine kinase n=1 Tax=Allorhizocola rhizosphaerae TaxID=1872709 RepID=UPI000E3BE371|nr:HAMP domain-containing sensor histidine kinase [Allorhizocola rhizosphaerae]
MKLIRRHWTIRARLTVVYGALFFLAGAVLLVANYWLVAKRLETVNIPLKGEIITAIENITNSPIEEKQRYREAYLKAQQEFRDETLETMLTQGGIALGGVGVMAVWLGWLTAGRALRPVKRMTETAKRVADRSLHERIGLTGPHDELRELGDTFDAMLERLDRAFDGQRRFVGNASHELRTPLAINRTLIEVALGRPGVCGEMRQLGETLLEVNARNERLIEGLLTLARSEATPTSVERVDLADIASHALEQVGTSSVHVRSTLDPAPTTGDPVMLERLAFNLVQNAVRYNTDGGWVSVRTHNGDGTVRLTVTNTGPVVPSYEIPRLFEPFRRLSDRVGSARGAGLGLSIVQSVARAHGGTVHATPHAGGGLTVQVTLPAS